jgi:hypothetical protein
MEKGLNIAVYRCCLCTRPFTEYRVVTGEGCRCGGKKFSPTTPSLLESIKLLPEVVKLILAGRREQRG